MINTHFKKIYRTSNYNFDRSKYLRLDRNERTIPFNKKILKDLKNYISNSIVQSYPITTDNLRNLISQKEKISKKYINIVPGSDGAIKYIFESFFRNKKKVITSIHPTYGMIDVYSRIYNYKIVKVKENTSGQKINNFFSKKSLFIYIANPNQPSGKSIDLIDILKIIKKAKKNGTYVVIDEAYIDFSKFKSAASLVLKFNNLIILKSLSKSFGIAGLRVGYIIANSEINKTLNVVRSPYDISSFSIKVAEYFLKNLYISRAFIKQINDTKKFLIKECIKRRLKFENTQTNFFYITIPGSQIKKIHNFMFKNKILVRSNYLGSFKNFKNTIRVTVGSKNQMKKFFIYFDKIYKKV